MDGHETVDLMNRELINCIKEYPQLYDPDFYHENYEFYWDEIQKQLGIQSEYSIIGLVVKKKVHSFNLFIESLLKRRWRKIHGDHKKISIYNHLYNTKIPVSKWENELNFLTIDLNNADNINIDDVTEEKIESFNVTQEMIDNCDINDSVTFESESDIQSREQKESSENTIQQTIVENNKIEKKPSTDRCEDAIFGELVTAMLKKLDPEEKKRAKKEIMNILL